MNLARFVISLNFDINSKGYNGMTAFLMACQKENLYLVQYLATIKGIDLEVKDSNECNALHIACDVNSFNLVKYLVSLNIFDLNDKNSDGQTALEMASDQKIIDFLSKKTQNRINHPIKRIKAMKEIQLDPNDVI